MSSSKMSFTQIQFWEWASLKYHSQPKATRYIVRIYSTSIVTRTQRRRGADTRGRWQWSFDPCPRQWRPANSCAHRRRTDGGRWTYPLIVISHYIRALINGGDGSTRSSVAADRTTLLSANSRPMCSSVPTTDPCAHQWRRQIRDLIDILNRIRVFVVIVLQTIEMKKASGRRSYTSSTALEEVDGGDRGNLSKVAFWHVALGWEWQFNKGHSHNSIWPKPAFEVNILVSFFSIRLQNIFHPFFSSDVFAPGCGWTRPHLLTLSLSLSLLRTEREERRGAAAAARHPRRFSFSYSIYISRRRTEIG